MLKRLSLLFIFVFFVFGLSSLGWAQKAIDPKKDPNLKAIYDWVVQLQHPTGLVSTREGKEGICFVYDQALAVDLFLLFDDVDRAKKILTFFKEKFKDQVQKGRFIGFVDMYFSTGAAGAVFRAGGPNAWLLNSINEYSYQTKDLQFLPLAEAIADWLIDLQAIDGGIMGGFHSNLQFISTEHNADTYAALRNLYYFTKKSKYAEVAEETKLWLKNVAYIPEDKRFGNGKNDSNYALDTSSWTVLALGPELKEVLDIADKVARTTQYYEFRQTNVEGYDFGGPYWGTPYPDKDAVWFEGTAQMVVAFQAVGLKEKADYFLKELEKCLTPSSFHPGTIGLPYASNPGTPPYGGWQMTNKPLALSSTVWYVFAKLEYNPFNLGGSKTFDSSLFDWPPKNIKPKNYVTKQFAPLIDDFEGTLAQFFTAYSQSEIEKDNSLFNRTMEFNQVQSGNQAMRLLFIPRGIEGIQGEFSQTEIYNFKNHANEKITITSTSLQPEFLTVEEKEEPVEDATEEQLDAKNQPAQAIVRRQFLTPQKWNPYQSLKISLKHDNSPNLFFIGIKDSEGKIWFSKEIPLTGKGWEEHTFAFNQDFRLLGSSTSKQSFVKVGVDELWLGLRSASPLIESIVYLDDISLQ